MELDDTDREILNMLQEDAKITHREISKKLYLTRTPIYERIRKMERAGVISKYVTLLNPNKIGKGLQAFCFVSLSKHGLQQVEEFQNQIKQFDPVMECFHIAGSFDFLMKVRVRDMDEYEHFVLKDLSGIKNIAHVQSSFVLGELKYELGYDLC